MKQKVWPPGQPNASPEKICEALVMCIPPEEDYDDAAEPADELSESADQLHRL